MFAGNLNGAGGERVRKIAWRANGQFPSNHPDPEPPSGPNGGGGLPVAKKAA